MGTGTYAANGTDLILQPETGQWLERELLGMDGNGRPIYTATRKFELKWGVVAPSEYNQLQNFFASIGATGSLVMDLPKYGSATWEFESYTGCYVTEPQAGTFFQQHYTNVTVVVTNIRT